MRIKWPNDVYAGRLKLGGILCHSSYRGQLFYVVMGVGLNLANRTPTTCVDALIAAAAAAQGRPPPPPVSREALLAGVLSRLEPMLAQLAAEGFGPFEAEYCRHWLHSGQQVRGRAMCGAVQLAGAPGAACHPPPLRPPACCAVLRCGRPADRASAAQRAPPAQVQLEEGGGLVPVTIRGLSPNGYLLVSVPAAHPGACCLARAAHGVQQGRVAHTCTPTPTSTPPPRAAPAPSLQAADAAGERYELHPDGNSLDFFTGLVRKKLPA